jgi:hypothetical protein
MVQHLDYFGLLSATTRSSVLALSSTGTLAPNLKSAKSRHRTWLRPFDADYCERDQRAHVDSDPTNAAYCSPDDFRVYIGCSAADSGANFEYENGGEK